MLHKLILSLAFALLLGISQQSALNHQIEHLADIGAHSEQQDQLPHHAGDCDHCLASGHFANSVTSHYQFAFDTSAIASQVAKEQHFHSVHSSRAYNSRAPPRLV
jgi:hypothetical protein